MSTGLSSRIFSEITCQARNSRVTRRHFAKTWRRSILPHVCNLQRFRLSTPVSLASLSCIKGLRVRSAWNERINSIDTRKITETTREDAGVKDATRRKNTRGRTLSSVHCLSPFLRVAPHAAYFVSEASNPPEKTELASTHSQTSHFLYIFFNLFFFFMLHVGKKAFSDSRHGNSFIRWREGAEGGGWGRGWFGVGRRKARRTRIESLHSTYTATGNNASIHSIQLRLVAFNTGVW